MSTCKPLNQPPRTEPLEVEQTIDRFGTYETRWACTAPPMGSLFKVTAEEWLDGDTVRVIWAYALIAGPDS